MHLRFNHLLPGYLLYVPVKLPADHEVFTHITDRSLLQPETEQVTILHCRILIWREAGLRIWPTTYLMEGEKVVSRLLFAFNIPFAPGCVFRKCQTEYACFTLIFEALPVCCRQFSLLELPAVESNPFFSLPIERNETDVYEVELYSAAYPFS